MNLLRRRQPKKGERTQAHITGVHITRGQEQIARDFAEVPETESGNGFDKQDDEVVLLLTEILRKLNDLEKAIDRNTLADSG